MGEDAQIQLYKRRQYLVSPITDRWIGIGILSPEFPKECFYPSNRTSVSSSPSELGRPYNQIKYADIEVQLWYLTAEGVLTWVPRVRKAKGV